MDSILPLSFPPGRPALPRQGRALVFVCAGAADVGALTDRAARKLHQDGLMAMSCLASIGARDADILFNTDLADQILVIDGCPKACGRRTFEQAGLPPQRLTHFDLTAVGLFKGSSPMTAENVERVAAHAQSLLQPGPAAGLTAPSALPASIPRVEP